MRTSLYLHFKVSQYSPTVNVLKILLQIWEDENISIDHWPVYYLSMHLCSQYVWSCSAQCPRCKLCLSSWAGAPFVCLLEDQEAHQEADVLSRWQKSFHGGMRRAFLHSWLTPTGEGGRHSRCRSCPLRLASCNVPESSHRCYLMYVCYGKETASYRDLVSFASYNRRWLMKWLLSNSFESAIRGDLGLDPHL